MEDELTRLNVIANHPAMEAVALMKAHMRNDAEAMYRMCEDSPNLYAVVSWLCGMVDGALDNVDYTMDQFLDMVAERAIEFIKGNARWGVPPRDVDGGTGTPAW